MAFLVLTCMNLIVKSDGLECFLVDSEHFNPVDPSLLQAFWGPQLLPDTSRHLSGTGFVVSFLLSFSGDWPGQSLIWKTPCFGTNGKQVKALDAPEEFSYDCNRISDSRFAYPTRRIPTFCHSHKSWFFIFVVFGGCDYGAAMMVLHHLQHYLKQSLHNPMIGSSRVTGILPTFVNAIINRWRTKALVQLAESW